MCNDLLLKIKKCVHANDVIYNRKEYKNGSDITYDEFEKLLQDSLNEQKYKEELFYKYANFYYQVRDTHINYDEKHFDRFLHETIDIEDNNFVAQKCKSIYYDLKNKITLNVICAVGLTGFNNAINIYFDSFEKVDFEHFKNYSINYIHGAVLEYCKEMSFHGITFIDENDDVKRNTTINKFSEIRRIESILENELQTSNITIEQIALWRVLYNKKGFDENSKEKIVNLMKNSTFSIDSIEVKEILLSNRIKNLQDAVADVKDLMMKYSNTNALPLEIADDKNQNNEDDYDTEENIRYHDGNLSSRIAYEDAIELDEESLKKEVSREVLDISKKILYYVNEENAKFVKDILNEDEQRLLKAVLLYKTDSSNYDSVLSDYENIFEQETKNKQLFNEKINDIGLTKEIDYELSITNNKYMKAEKLLIWRIKVIFYKIFELVKGD